MMPCFVNPKVNIPGIFEMHGFKVAGIFMYRQWWDNWQILVPPVDIFNHDRGRDLIQAAGSIGAAFQLRLITEFPVDNIPIGLKDAFEMAVREY